ncbi:MAG TPA: hypothetical protein VN763_14560 [Saprospiraceae bacterium]|nr:hypothetical protein [Saprospiraceae bacterium]
MGEQQGSTLVSLAKILLKQKFSAPLRPEAKEAEEQKGRKGENWVVFIINNCMSVVYINSWDNFPHLSRWGKEGLEQ